MLEMLTGERYELKNHDDYDKVLCEWQENFAFIRSKLFKKSKKSKTEPLLKIGIHEHDGKSSFEMIHVNYKNILQRIDASFQNVGVNSHCSFFEFVVTAKMTVCFKNQKNNCFTKTFSEKGTYREKKVSEKIAYTKLVTTFAKRLEKLEREYGPIDFDAIPNFANAQL